MQTKRRVIVSSASHKFENKPFFIKFPCPNVNEGTWTNLAVDLYSFINAFKGQTYRSLDAIYITGHFKLRRVYTTNTKPEDASGDNQAEGCKLINLYDIFNIVFQKTSIFLQELNILLN